ncbi:MULTISPECIES: lasso peptide biosynthesis PqqD family chaperone [unclassified Streptomyces]|uniref:lasso peptide biosynthesis PqqD family chaperone n=1 Tax=unclassified Streptomyces TaxID=2593676 RepID=UPI002DD88D86|nr:MULTISPECIES: lasso peptide biosynthesis PqqD family chaperone [unclassified Streptomyces]WSA90725.1 lasso peptide biosynthesis PqqD family chaperone [Streptomyces sp. NBC_01795]WSB75049.1 lasso peptide biosynthesis PqqD family chaperone [Streptomyces sp. NBC_01775]WSS16671.1 lasso peptide biosynthesis PqqD family chaperone [Streptomyces sp. NBC_01186]WSS45489.1 lasso peptide biosynthesis PqqD family chaperone [Streptomyces sp. NBC_01187]
MTYALPPDVIATRTEDGMVLLQETTGRYWMLNGTGAAVVQLLTEGKTVPAIVAELGTHFGQDPERVAADVRALLEQLGRARLVTS